MNRRIPSSLAPAAWLLVGTMCSIAQAQQTAASPEISGDRLVTFRIAAPKAAAVTIAGEWTGGERKELAKDEKGNWSITVGPLAPELYWYMLYVDGVPTIDPKNPRVKIGRSLVNLFEAPGDPPTFSQLRKVPHGALHVHSYDSKSLGIPRRLHVYTPPGYDPRDATTTYPVLYLLHGSGDNDEGWTNVGLTHHILDNLLAEKKARPMIVVMPHGHAVPANASQEVRRRNTPEFEKDLLGDIIPLVERSYNVKTDAANRALAGLSMGGSQSLTIGLANQDKFAWIGVFSSAPRTLDERLLASIADANAVNGKLKLFWIGCGQDDGVFGAAEGFTKTLKERGIRHVWRPSEGGHSWPVWRNYLHEVAPLLFVDGSASRPNPPVKDGIRPSNDTVRVAGIVLKWIRGDKAANFRRVEPLIREAAAGGAKIACTTECFLDGYAIADKSIPLDDYRALGEPIPDGPYFKRLCELAKELRIHLIAGMLEADGEARFNTAVIIGPDGKLLGKYHKQQLEHELVRNTAGKESSVFATEYGKVGVMICADRRFPDVVKGFCSAGADFLICPSGGMFGPKSNDHILQARSKENGKHIVFVHPAEFLVTAPNGSIVQQTVLGDKLLIPPGDAGKDSDSQRVFYFDLPLK